MATTISVHDPTRCGTQREKLPQTSMPPLLSKRSTCLIACLVTSPRACARAWPIIATATDAPVMTPSVAAASESTRLAWRSWAYRPSINARTSFSRPLSRNSAAPAPRVLLDQRPGGRLGVTGRQAPRLLHVARMYTHDGTELIGVRGGDASVAQLARPP